MKKYFIILFSIITMHSHAMETENNTNTIVSINLKKYPIELLNLIAQFLSFHDYETEQEFIERTQALTIKELPKTCLIYFSFEYSAYSPNNAIIAASASVQECFSRYHKVLPLCPKVCIVDRKTNQKKDYEDVIPIYHQKLAVSNNGNMIATINTHYNTDPLTRVTTKRDALYITNVSTKKEESHDLPLSFELCDKHPAIAFNKQNTDIIVHAKNYQHTIFPLTINTPDQNADHKKTLTKYFAQQGICKNLIEQINAKK